MANIRPFLIMDKLQAARFIDETAGDENRLEPRLVRGGSHAGKYALNEGVIYDDAHEARRDMFRMLTVVSLDTDEAFPPEPEPDEDA